MAYEDRPLMLSQAPDGEGVLITSTNPGSPTFIHIATEDPLLTDILELTVSNIYTEDVELTLYWGGANENRASRGLVEHEKFERQLTLPKPIRNGLIVSAYASVPNVIRIWQGGGTCQIAILEG